MFRSPLTAVQHSFEHFLPGPMTLDYTITVSTWTLAQKREGLLLIHVGKMFPMLRVRLAYHFYNFTRGIFEQPATDCCPSWAWARLTQRYSCFITTDRDSGSSSSSLGFLSEHRRRVSPHHWLHSVVVPQTNHQLSAKWLIIHSLCWQPSICTFLLLSLTRVYLPSWFLVRAEHTSTRKQKEQHIGDINHLKVW